MNTNSLLLTIRDFLVTVHFEQWYALLLTFLASVITEMLFSVLGERRREKVSSKRKNTAKEFKREASSLGKDWRKEKREYQLKNGRSISSLKWDVQDLESISEEEYAKTDRVISLRVWQAYHPSLNRFQRIVFELWNRLDFWPEKFAVTGFWETLCFLLLYIIVYLVSCGFFLWIGILLFTAIRGGSPNIWIKSIETFGYYLREYKAILIIFPLAVKAISVVIKYRSKVLKIAIILLMVIIMIAIPSLVTYPSKRTPIEPLLLEQIQKVPFPYVTRFYNSDSYWSSVKPALETQDYNSAEQQNDSEPEPLPDENTDGLNFNELMERAEKCWNRDREKAEVFIYAAHDIYDKDNNKDPYYMGLMWYYLGDLENSVDYYVKGGEAFQSDTQWMNAGLCFSAAYRLEQNQDFADWAVTCFFNATKKYDLSQNHRNHISRFVCYLQRYYDGSIPYLDELCAAIPNDMGLHMVRIMRHISNGSFSEEDAEVLNQFQGSYWDSPKLVLTLAYWDFSNGRVVDVNALYNDYSENRERYYPEDIINLAWFLYSDGEYSKAVRLLADVVDIDGNPVPDSHLLCAELFLQDEDITGVDGKALVRHLTEVDTSFYGNDDQIRFGITSILLAGRVGTSVDMSKVLVLSQQLFDAESLSEKLIQATLSYESGDYELCNETCNQILEMDLSESDKRKVLFLKSDALVGWAGMVSEEESGALLEEALEIMESVEADVEDDFVECLRRLHTIYDAVGDEEARDEIGQKLQVFN